MVSSVLINYPLSELPPHRAVIEGVLPRTLCPAFGLIENMSLSVFYENLVLAPHTGCSLRFQVFRALPAINKLLVLANFGNGSRQCFLLRRL